ncbi:MAG: hypothetical protein K0R54_773 [Clostridiaceae bacterium]|jgi:hypothetical protein|nr:hypothetical protein [Clostridiaceae bacterium]
MSVLEKGFLNNAKGIKIDDWVDQFKTMNLDMKKLKEHYESLSEDKKTEWIEKSIKKNGGVRVQLEDWSDDYPNVHAYADVVGTYPISKKSLFKGGLEYPKLNQSFRCALKFPSTEEARDAFNKLVNGETNILDYVTYFEQEELVDCL